MIDKKELHAIAQAAANHIKTEEDHNEFRQMLPKITVDAALNVELADHLGFAKHEQSEASNSRNGTTGAVIEQVDEWQSRPLDAIQPIVYLDRIAVKIRQNKKVINKAIYLALGVNLEGHKEL